MDTNDTITQIYFENLFVGPFCSKFLQIKTTKILAIILLVDEVIVNVAPFAFE
jgi:hypothetical protein